MGGGCGCLDRGGGQLSLMEGWEGEEKGKRGRGRERDRDRDRGNKHPTAAAPTPKQ